MMAMVMEGKTLRKTRVYRRQWKTPGMLVLGLVGLARSLVLMALAVHALALA